MPVLPKKVLTHRPAWVTRVDNMRRIVSASGAPFPSRHPELTGVRTKSEKDFPNHVVFYVERDHAIEIMRVLRGGQDMSIEVEKI